MLCLLNMDALQAISASGGADKDYMATIDKFLAAVDEETASFLPTFVQREKVLFFYA